MPWIVRSGKLTLGAEFSSEENAQRSADFYNNLPHPTGKWEPVFDKDPWGALQSSDNSNGKDENAQ